MTRKLEGDQSGCSRGRRAPPHDSGTRLWGRLEREEEKFLLGRQLVVPGDLPP